MATARPSKHPKPKVGAAARRPRVASTTEALQRYRAKRNFRKTAEPAGRASRKAGGRRFVIQKHAATRLHYDFRLEVDGTLKSWAVPKGLPTRKGDKRLAVQVEDHPIEYGSFEGTIPKGEYGGGTVMLWDEGSYENLGGDTGADWAAGKLHFRLTGHKLNGEWTLVRIKHGEGNEWLLIKTGETVKAIPKAQDDRSCVSGRTMQEIAGKAEATWHSSPRATRSQARAAAQPRKEKRSRRGPALHFIAPMKATLVSEPPRQGEWIYELKFDGYRALALKSGRDVQLLSRNEKDFAARYPEIAEAVKELDEDDIILDGEIVALTSAGVPSFQLLQGAEGGARPPLAYYVFDLLHRNGKDWTGRPLHERRAELEKVLRGAGEPLRYSGNLAGPPARLLREVCRRGLEGLIGKKGDSRYEAGRRSPSWIKLKCGHEQEFVIGGYTPPEGTRKHFGALLVGVYEGKELRFAGKVGTGFTAALLKDLHERMRALAQDECPFANLPEKQPGRWRQNITPAEMRRCHWVAPKLVGQVRFTEWTEEGKLRHPAFLGLREDKPAAEVIREVPA